MRAVKLIPWERISRVGYIPATLESITSAKQRSGADIVLNANLFDMDGGPVWGVMAAGKWLTESMGGAGLHFKGGSAIERAVGSAVSGGDFLAGYPELVADGRALLTASDPAFTSARGRTGVGLREDGLVLYVCSDGTDAVTTKELAARMVGLGCRTAMQYDSGSSSQLLSPDEQITTGRKCSGYIGVWLDASSKRRLFSKEYHGKNKLSGHFTVAEFACKDGADAVALDGRLPGILEEIRAACGNRPVTVNSGYRTALHNKAVGGAAASQHLTGSAADITIRGVATIEMCKAAEKALTACGVGGGIGLYTGQSFVHVDVRAVRTRWQQDKAGQSAYSVPGWAEQSAARPTLRRGDKGDAVKELQRALARRGANITSDGAFGTKTEAAVRAFQRQMGLAIDGIVGAKTWACL